MAKQNIKIPGGKGTVIALAIWAGKLILQEPLEKLGGVIAEKIKGRKKKGEKENKNNFSENGSTSSSFEAQKENPRPANDPNAPKPANRPNRVKLAGDWFHSHDRVVLLAPKKCGKTTLAMTIAYDLCQGKSPRVFDQMDNIPQQYVIYYQFDLDEEALNEYYPSAKELYPWLEIICVPGFEVGSFFEDAQNRINKRNHPMVTIFVDNLDKIRAGKAMGKPYSDEKFFEHLDIFRNDMRKEGYQVTTIILNHTKASWKSDKCIPVTEEYMRGSEDVNRRVDQLFSLGPTREGESVKMIRDCLNRHRSRLDEVIVVRRINIPDMMLDFERWDNEDNMLPLKKTYGKKSNSEKQTLHQRVGENENNKRVRRENINWSDDMLLAAAEIIDKMYFEAKQHKVDEPSLSALAEAIKNEFHFERFEKQQVKRLIEHLQSQGILESKTLIIEMANRTA